MIDETAYKQKIGAMLDRADALGPAAYSAAVSLLSTDLTLDEILQAARRRPQGGPPSESIHRSSLISVGSHAVGLPPMQSLQTEAQKEMHRQIASIAYEAATTRVTADGIRFRGDELDAAFYRKGQLEAQKLCRR